MAAPMQRGLTALSDSTDNEARSIRSGVLSDTTEFETEHDSSHSTATLRIESVSYTVDPVVHWVYRPRNVFLVFCIFSALATFAYHTENLYIPKRIKSHAGMISSIAAFELMCLLNFRDGGFRRPHPSIWRLVLGLNTLYAMALFYLLWQDLSTARSIMRYFDRSLIGPPAPRHYAQNCDLSWKNIKDAADIFMLAHFLGWFGKAIVLRDFWVCTILSVAYEIMEYSLQHQIPEFHECWWDHWNFDVFGCNLAGTIIGLLTIRWMKVTPFSWRGHSVNRQRGIRKIVRDLGPMDYLAFDWQGTKKFRNYLSLVVLIAVFLAAEVNVFYLKELLWIDSSNPIVTLRLVAIWLFALPGTYEYFIYVTFSKKVKRMGMHAWLLVATVALELLIVLKWSTWEQFPNPAPRWVKVMWILIISALILYPTIKFGIGNRRRSKNGIKKTQ